jgi:hypothetical protein
VSDLVPTPEDWEVVQQYQEYQPQNVPVTINGIVVTTGLPAKYSVMRQIIVDSVTDLGTRPNELIPADPRLKRVILWTTSANVTVGTVEQIMKPGTPDGFLLPQNSPLEWEGFKEPIYGVSTSAVAVNIRYEYWAD